MTGMEIEFRLQSDPQMLQVLRAGIAQFCKMLGFDEETRSNIVLAVDEASTNIIRHAYGGRTDQEIRITCGAGNDVVEFVLRDFGEKADEKAIRPRALDEVRPGGLGVHFIRSVMNEMFFDQVEQGNRLVLRKQLPGSKSQEPSSKLHGKKKKERR